MLSGVNNGKVCCELVHQGYVRAMGKLTLRAFGIRRFIPIITENRASTVALH
jgi:hypothetical protein